MKSDTDECIPDDIAEIDEQIDNCVMRITLLLDACKANHKESNLQHTENICAFLNRGLTLLHENEGLEQFLLPHMEEFRVQNHIQLLSVKCITSDIGNNNEPKSAAVLWKELASCLQHFMHRELAVNIQKCDLDNTLIRILFIKDYLTLLKAFWEPTVVWELYKDWRAESLEQFASKCDKKSCFVCLLKFCFYCMSEDQILIHVNEFQPILITWSDIFAIYLPFIYDHLKSLMHILKHCTASTVFPPQLSAVLKCSQLSNYCDACYSCTVIKKIHSDVFQALGFFNSASERESITAEDSFYHLHLSVILEIINSLFTFDYQARALTIAASAVQEYLHLHNFHMNIISQGSDFTLPSESPDSSPDHNSGDNSHKGNIDAFHIKWRKLFETAFLTDIQKRLQGNVEEIVHTNIKEEESLMSLHDPQLLISENVMGLDSPFVQLHAVLPSVLNTVIEFERYLPMVYASDGPLFSFKSSFCHTVNIYITDLIEHIHTVSQGPAKHKSIYYLYIASRSAIYLEERIKYYCDVIGHGRESKHLTGILKKSKALVKDLKEQIFIHNWKYVCCGILFDAHSYDFDDTKQFFEGERVSFSIQMWNLHMKALYSELQFYLPQKLAQHIYTRVLSDSLYQFAARYGHCSPTQARTPLVKKDILTLLLCTSQLILYSCNSATQIISRVTKTHVKAENDKQPEVCALVTRIHSTCSTLLTIMAILSAPISKIYKVFKKGFPSASLSLRSSFNVSAHWLSWVRPDLFAHLGKETLMSSVSVYLTICICTAWLQPNPFAIVKAFTEHHYVLSIMFMCQATEMTKTMGTFVMRSSRVKLANSIFRLLSCCNGDGFTAVLLPVMARENGWTEFDKLNIDKLLIQRPWWYEGFISVLDPFAKCVICDIFPLLKQCQKKFSPDTVIDAWQKMKCDMEGLVVCSCRDNFDYNYSNEQSGSVKKNETKIAPSSVKETQKGNSPKSIAYTFILDVLESINNYVLVIPVSVRHGLMSLHTHFKTHIADVQPIRQSLPLQVLLSTVISYLRDSKLLEHTLGCKLKTDELRMCDTTAHALNLFALKNQVTENITKKQLSNLEKALNSVIKHFGSSNTGTDVLLARKFRKSVMNEEFYSIAIAKFSEFHDGPETGQYLQKLLTINKSWMQHSLGIPEMFSSNSLLTMVCPEALLVNKSHLSIPAGFSAPESLASEFWNEQPSGLPDSEVPKKPHQLNLNVDHQSLSSKKDFNPFDHFNSLGESNFNEAAELMSDLQWEALLSHLPVLGLTEVQFCNLFIQRWDVREEGPVPPAEKEMILDLKTSYDIP